MIKKRCELLAPAGSKEAFIAAVESGADAIYCGGELFNARIGARNFNEEELKEAIKFAHKRLVSVYVTLNTLIGDDEFSNALEYAKRLYEIGADGVIIQDLGLGNAIKKEVPNLSLHLSTQGSVYDLRGAKAAAKFGYERVVLARELSLKEIENVCKNAPIEVEVFCHGAICFCYSGQCHLSRSMGGRSGNKGTCAQPCRMLYTQIKENDNNYLSDEKDTSHSLSPADLSLVEHIGELIAAGVSSLKIEGRMKSPEYVAAVTSVYRKYIDMYYLTGKVEVDEVDELALKQIFNRGFTDAYLTGTASDTYMSKDVPKNHGIFIGNVVRRIKGTNLLDISLKSDLMMGDGIEIRGRKVTGNPVTFYEEREKGIVRIGDIKGVVKEGEPVYKVQSRKQLDELAKYYKGKDWNSGNYLRKIKLSAKCEILKSGRVKLSLEELLTRTKVSVVSSAFNISIDSKYLLSDRIEKAIRKTGGTPFSIDKVEILGNVNLDVKVSDVNKLRREALALMEEKLSGIRHKSKGGVGIQSREVHVNRGGSQIKRELELYFFTYSAYEKLRKKAELRKLAEQLGVSLKFVVPAAEYVTRCTGESDDIVTYISNISKGKEDYIIEKNFDTVCKIASENGIYVGNIGWFTALKDAGVPVMADYGLNAYNSATKGLLLSLGAESVRSSLEGEDESGVIPLMVSEHDSDESYLKDRKGVIYKIIKRDFSDQEIIIKDKQVDIVGEMKKIANMSDEQARKFAGNSQDRNSPNYAIYNRRIYMV